jgi:uncharacterized membrane protein
VIRARTGLLMLALVAGGFFVNASVRMPCRDVCGADIGRLYEDRGIDRAHPPYFERDLEYPPVIGMLMWAAALPFDQGLRVKFVLNAIVLLGLALATTWALWLRYGKRTWRWALAPPLLLEGLTNWDLLAVAPATIGLMQWEAGSAALAGGLIGVGAAAKLMPALYLPVLIAACVPARAWKRARDVFVGAVVGCALFVLPVYAVKPHAFTFFVNFHRARGPSRATIWFFMFRDLSMHQWLTQHTVIRVINIAIPILLGAALALVLWQTARGRIPPIAACAIATIAFVLTNKIYSPQYDLWLVPFFVMVPVRTKFVVHFYVSSVLVWFFNAVEGHALHRPLSLYVLGAAAAYRLVVELLLVREFVRCSRDEFRVSVQSEPATAR